MMDSLKFLNCIKFREQFTKAGLADFVQLAKDYPYCHSVHLLLLKKLHEDQNQKFESQLGYSALHVIDRAILYNLVHFDRFSVDQKLVAVQVPAVEARLHSPVTKTEVKEEATKEEVAVAEETIPEVKETVEEIVEEEVQEKVETVEVDAPETVEEPVKEEVEEAGPVSDIGLAVLNFITKSSDSVEEAVTEKEVEEVPVKEEVVEPEVEEQPSVEAEEKVEEIKEDVLEQQTEDVVDSEPKADHKGLEEKLAIIDKFIEEEPRIKPVDKEYSESEEIAAKSLSQSDLMVTETLARIHLKQGNSHRAIEIYEKLSLKFPEKKLYFAGQIEYIRKGSSNT